MKECKGSEVRQDGGIENPGVGIIPPTQRVETVQRILWFSSGPDDWKHLLAEAKHWRQGFSARTLLISISGAKLLRFGNEALNLPSYQTWLEGRGGVDSIG